MDGYAESKVAYQWWRWPLLPFAAVIGAALATAALVLVQWMGMKFSGGYSPDGWYFRYILPIISSGFFGFMYAKISYHVAPSGKMIAGVVMVTLLGMFSALSAFLGWVMPEYSTGQAVQVTLGSIATIAAAIMALLDRE